MNEYDYCRFVDGIQYGVKKDNTEKPFAAVIGVNTLVDFSGKKVDILSHIDGFPVTLIDERAFSDCSDIEEIILPNTITVIEGDAFAHSCIKHIEIPDSVTAIDAFAFYKCENLEEIIFGKGIKHISNCAFAACNKLKEINFPSSLQTFYLSAIEACESLERVYISGDSFEFVEGDHMGFGYKCPNLKYITTPPSNTRYIAINNVLYDYKEGTLIRVPQASNLTSFTLPRWVKRCENNSLYNIPNLKKLTIHQKELKNFRDSGLYKTHIEKLRCNESSNVGVIARNNHLKTIQINSDLNEFLDELSPTDKYKNI